MALLFLDGVDNYQIVGGTLSGPSAPNIGYSITQSNANGNQVTIGPGTNTSSRCFAISRATNGFGRVAKQIKVPGNNMVIGFALKSGARQSICKIANVFEVLWPITGYPKIGDVSGGTIPILNTWYYWELEISRLAKTVTVWLNGYKQFTAPFTADVPETIEVSWGWNDVGEATTLYVDDIYVLDDVATSPTAKVARLGPIEIATRLPTASVTADWAPTPSTKANWKIVSQIPAVQTEFVESNVVGATELYSSATTVTKDVLAVAVTALTAKTDIDEHDIALVIKDGVAEKEATSIPLSTQYTYVQSIFEADPQGVAWTPSTASAVNFGIRVK